MNRFENKVVMIVGATSGIGKTTALAFANEGATVVATGRRQEEGQSLVDEIKRNGGEAIFVKADGAIAADVENSVNQAISAYGKLDCAFNNLGIGGAVAPITDLEESDWDDVININLKSIFLCMKYQLAAMVNNGGGVIVNNASIYGKRATNIGLSGYTASKHGVIGLTKSAALEYATQGIRVNAVCPGWVRTDANAAVLSDPQMEAAVVDSHPVKRLGTQQEIAEAVMWLCSDGAGFVTAQELIIDGGKTSLC